MEDSFISVEELSICLGDNKVVKDEKDLLKDEDEDDIQCERIRKTKNSPGDKKKKHEINRVKSPIQTRPNGQQMPSKHSTLPSLGQGRDSSLAENFERSRAQQDAVWTLCTALNVPSKEHSSSASSITSSDPQLHLSDKGSECKTGRKILAPLHDRKQHLHSKHSGNESLVLKPQTPPKGKQRRNDKESDHEVHFTPISKTPTFGQEEDSGVKSYDDIIKPKAKFLSPTQGLKEDLSAEDFQQNRRFSLPVSPRLLRRFHKEKLYSSKADGSEREDRHNHPERSSIFSPPSKKFDSIQDKKDDDKFIISNDFIPLKANRENRRSLDLNLGTSSLRFLSEIKVSLGKEQPSSDPVFPKVKTKSEQRKNSYSLSASSEAIFRESLPEVVAPSILPLAHPNGRNRASTFTSLETVVPFESKMLGKTLEAPMFLEVAPRRLSHLNLSPRLSRKR